MVPFLNIFAFGYLYRFSAKMRREGKVRLPDWNDWPGLFADGLKFGIVWVAYWLAPILLAFVFFGMFVGLGLGALGYLLVAFVFLIASIMFCSALYRLHMYSDYKALLDVALVLQMSCAGVSSFILPVLVFTGFCVLVLPLYGFAFFLGFLFLISQTSLYFRTHELRR